MRIDGAVLLTGATGFVGGGILFSLLARASELGVTKIVLMIRQRSGKTLDERVAKLRENPMFDGLRETFDKLVVGLEGDVSQRNFGWKESSMSWPHQETLKVFWDLLLSSLILYHPLYVQFTVLWFSSLRLAWIESKPWKLDSLLVNVVSKARLSCIVLEMSDSSNQCNKLQSPWSLLPCRCKNWQTAGNLNAFYLCPQLSSTLCLQQAQKRCRRN